jgi:tetratricopeptide (TPR) repeat protein
MHTFTVEDLYRKYGVPARTVARLVRDGFVTPERGPRREYRFSFVDINTIRMAHDLQLAGIAPAKVTRFLRDLRRDRPEQARVAAIGREMVVRDGAALLSESGQLVMDFAQLEQPAPQADLRKHSARAWFELAEQMEDTDPLRAIECYRIAIERDLHYAEAYANLCCVLVEGHQWLEALAVCLEGVNYCPEDSLLRYDLGVVCDELGRPEEAFEAYSRALELDPGFSDAHFNIALIFEAHGDHAAALRHLSAYRRLTK